MAFKDFSDQEKAVDMLQRSLERGRLAHGYLFSGPRIEHLEEVARTLAKALNCQRPLNRGGNVVDSCDQCLSCRNIQQSNHPDVHWVRPESKSRVITIDQMRDLMQQINLKPTEASYKVAIIAGADRLNVAAANAFLKTLEEPPANSIMILLTTDAERILETIVSRCLRLSFAGGWVPRLSPPELAWLRGFADLAALEQKSLIGRYRLMDGLLKELTQLKTGIEERLAARSPLHHYKDVEKNLQERWEEELKAAIEAEYRRQRAGVLVTLQWWLRDVWLRSMSRERKEEVGQVQELFTFPDLQSTARVADRISPGQALENLRVMEQLQRWLHSNVQEGLALEVGLLKLSL